MVRFNWFDMIVTHIFSLSKAITIKDKSIQEGDGIKNLSEKLIKMFGNEGISSFEAYDIVKRAKWA